MESTGSTAPAADTSLAIRDENLVQESPVSSPTLSNMVQEMVPEASFKCRHCPRTFTTARGLGGHQKAHRNLRQVRQIHKGHRRLAPATPQVRVSSSLSNSHVPGLRNTNFDLHAQLFNSYRMRMHNFPSSSRSGVVPLFAGTGGLAPAQQPSAATGDGGHVGSGGHVGISRQVNQDKTAQYFSWLRSSAVPLFVSQTGSRTSGLAQPLLAAPAPAADGNGGTGDGVHLGRQQDMPEANLEKTTDRIDLTLRL